MVGWTGNETTHLWRFTLYHKIHFWYVQSSCSNICCHENREFPLSKTLVCVCVYAKGIVPVVSPVAIGTGGGGEILNVDGDRAAAHVAGAAGAGRVLFITDVDGLLDGSGALVESLTKDGAEKARAGAGPGMEKKLLAAGEALAMGVGEAIIASGRRKNPISAAIAHDGCTVIRND